MHSVNGRQFDIMDGETARRYEKAVAFLQMLPTKKPEKISELIKSECAGARTFFDLLFGEGEGVKMLPKDNLSQAYDSIEEVILAVENQMEQVKKREEKWKKYSPERAARV